LSLMSGAALKRVKPTVCAKPRRAFTAATLVLTVAALAAEPSALVRVASRAVCTSSTVARFKLVPVRLRASMN
jgi:hypothetical protein